MNTKDKQVWTEALLLWKTLSEMPDKEIIGGKKMIKKIENFKNNILKKLNIGKKQYGCSFCEEYPLCLFCPIKYYCSTSYRNWSNYATSYKKHSQKYAKKFYEDLLQLYEKIKDEQSQNFDL